MLPALVKFISIYDPSSLFNFSVGFHTAVHTSGIYRRDGRDSLR